MPFMSRDYEKTGLQISMAGSALLSLSAIVMALIIQSQAVLLDGLYTFTTLIMSLISLKIVDLVNRPETRNRPFGYMALEPFSNLIKSLVMVVLLLVFLVTNIQEIFTGGRVISLNLTMLYTVVCMVIYLVIIVLLKKCGRKSRSSILELEVRSWFIDTLLTAGMGVSLVVAMVLMRLGYTGILPYVDPVIVIALIVVSFPVPLKVVLVEFRRLLLVSPENSIEDEVKGLLRDVIEHYGMIDVQVWALKSGRTQYFFLYSSLREEHTTIRRLDEIRLAIFRELAKQYPKFWADIMFTRINPENTTESLLESADVRVDR